MDLEMIEGVVEAVTYRNDQNGYTVMQVSSDGTLITAVGQLPAASAGDCVILQGQYTVHKTYGRQFAVSAMEISRPQTAEAIFKYLSSGAIRGIGPSTAGKIVDEFGENSLEVLEHQPERLAQIKGISLKKAKEIGKLFASQFGMREVMIRFANYGITNVESLNIYRAFGARSVELIEQNPYLLCENDVGFSFERADSIAADLGLSAESDARLEQGLIHVLRHNAGNGHTCLPETKLIMVGAKLLQVDTDSLQSAADRLCNDGRLIRTMRGEMPLLSLQSYYESERYVASRLQMMLSYPPSPILALPERIDAIEAANGIQYEKLQREAITRALSDGLLILTGGPGTGKTTTIKAIITLLQQQDLEIALAAPTGRAAKRMQDLTGTEAKTLHRLLEAEWGTDDRLTFARNEKNPLSADAVIIDELSMVDIKLFESLLKALRLGCRLIMVGDPNQLPAVGAGNVLGDMMNAGTIPVVKLDTIFRQAMKSLIITNAHHIVKGEMPDLSRRDGDFFMVHCENPVVAAKTLRDLCSSRLPEAFDLDAFTDIQLLCPSRIGETGSMRMNQLMCDVLNPPAAGKREIMLKHGLLREGDKVMQVRNNYDILWTARDGKQGSGVFNGDIGILRSVDPVSGLLGVEFDDHIATYTPEEAADLEQAYAITVHKSQGSEYECVVIPVTGVPEKLAYRNLLYTGVTRAKRLLVLVGGEDQVSRMVTNHVKSLRYTQLAGLLLEST